VIRLHVLSGPSCMSTFLTFLNRCSWRFLEVAPMGRMKFDGRQRRVVLCTMTVTGLCYNGPASHNSHASTVKISALPRRRSPPITCDEKPVSSPTSPQADIVAVCRCRDAQVNLTPLRGIHSDTDIATSPSFSLMSFSGEVVALEGGVAKPSSATAACLAAPQKSWSSG
jgi:hypothetical protein